MKRMNSVVVTVLCAVVMIGVSVLGTLAYLQAQTAPVTNTFVAGKVAISLMEYEIDVNGKAVADTAVNVNGSIKLVPGRVIEKKPFITVSDDSEECYLFVKVENGLADYGTIQWAAGWQEMSPGVWYCETKQSENAKVYVFDSFKCKDTIANYNNFTGTITIIAYAVQAEGFADAAAAWSATFGNTP